MYCESAKQAIWQQKRELSRDQVLSPLSQNKPNSISKSLTMAQVDSDSSYIPSGSEAIDVLSDDEEKPHTALPTLRWRTVCGWTNSLTLRSEFTLVHYQGPTLLLEDALGPRLVDMPAKLDQEFWTVGFDNSQTPNNSIKIPGDRPQAFGATATPYPRGQCSIVSREEMERLRKK